MYAYPKRQDFLADALAWQLRREQGLVWSELEGEALQAKAPALNREYRFGIWVPAGAWCSNPGQYVSHLVAAAQRHGAQWLTTQVHRLQLQSGQCVGVHTDQGPQMLDRVIIAAGIRSPEFARQAGDRLPLASERGYHVVLPHAGLELPVPIMPSDGRMANTPTTPLRVSETAGLMAGSMATTGRCVRSRRLCTATTVAVLHATVMALTPDAASH